MTASAKPSARGSFAGSRRGYVAAFDAAYGLWRWVKNSSITTGRDEAIAVTADPQGNAVVVGYTDQVVGTQHTYTFCDATIVKYSPTGVKLWSSQLGDGTKYSTAVYWSVVAFKTEIFAVGTSSFGVDTYASLFFLAGKLCHIQGLPTLRLQHIVIGRDVRLRELNSGECGSGPDNGRAWTRMRLSASNAALK